MNSSVLSALRKELENSFGRKIVSSRDCLLLVEDIYQKTGYTINANTLRRFFGLVKTTYSASPSTVTILSKYCGFSSIDEIENISSQKPAENSISKEEVLHYLISLFKNMEVEEGHNKIVESVIYQTTIFLERNPDLIDRFQRETAKLPAGKYYYYEIAVNMDRLNSYYGNGLRHYLRSNTDNESKLFAHSLLAFRYWLTEENNLMEKHMAELSAIHVNHSYPSYVLGRLIAARLYFAHVRSESIDKILVDATKYHVAIMTSRGNSSPSFPDFELAVAEALILTNHHEEALDYIRRGKSFFAGFKGIGPRHPFSFWEKLIHNKKNTHLIMPEDQRRKSPDQATNYPQNKRYYSLLSLLQNPSVKPSQLAPLVDETGFKRFFHLYTRKVENS